MTQEHNFRRCQIDAMPTGMCHKQENNRIVVFVNRRGMAFVRSASIYLAALYEWVLKEEQHRKCVQRSLRLARSAAHKV